MKNENLNKQSSCFVLASSDLFDGAKPKDAERKTSYDEARKFRCPFCSRKGFLQLLKLSGRTFLKFGNSKAEFQ